MVYDYTGFPAHTWQIDDEVARHLRGSVRRDAKALVRLAVLYGDDRPPTRPLV